MTEYDSQISFELAVLLKDYGLPSDYYYDDNKELDIPNSSYYFDYKYPAPSYGEVFDWLSGEGVTVTLEPFFTFSLNGNVGYTWRIDIVDSEYAKLETITENDLWNSGKGYGGSFKLQADEAIKEAIKHI